MMGNASLDGNFPFIPSVPSEKISGWALRINVDSASLNSLNSLSSLNSLALRLVATYPYSPLRENANKPSMLSAAFTISIS